MRWKSRRTRYEWMSGPPYNCVQLGIVRERTPGYLATPTGIGGRRQRKRRRAESRKLEAEHQRHVAKLRARMLERGEDPDIPF
jgi:hypothetical protein